MVWRTGVNSQGQILAAGAADTHWGNAPVDTFYAGWLEDSLVRSRASNHTQTFNYQCDAPAGIKGELYCDNTCRVFLNGALLLSRGSDVDTKPWSTKREFIGTLQTGANILTVEVTPMAPPNGVGVINPVVFYF